MLKAKLASKRKSFRPPCVQMIDLDRCSIMAVDRGFETK